MLYFHRRTSLLLGHIPTSTIDRSLLLPTTVQLLPNCTVPCSEEDCVSVYVGASLGSGAVVLFSAWVCWGRPKGYLLSGFKDSRPLCVALTALEICCSHGVGGVIAALLKSKLPVGVSAAGWSLLQNVLFCTSLGLGSLGLTMKGVRIGWGVSGAGLPLCRQ